MILAESGRLEFEEFVTLAAKFIVEEDAEALEKELREAFRLYDKAGKFFTVQQVWNSVLPLNRLQNKLENKWIDGLFLL